MRFLAPTALGACVFITGITLPTTDVDAAVVYCKTAGVPKGCVMRR